MSLFFFLSSLPSCLFAGCRGRAPSLLTIFPTFPVSIIAAVAVIVASFLTGNTEEGANYVPATLGVPKQSFLSGYTNLANIIFAFQGQSMFYEMAAEMKNLKALCL